MQTNMKIFQNKAQGFLFAGALLAVALVTGPVHAADNIATILREFANTQLGIIPNIVSAFCYVGGIFMMVAGVIKLKEHADNPNGAKMTPALVRLVVGAALVVLPTLTEVLLSSTQLSGSGSGASFQAFSLPGI